MVRIGTTPSDVAKLAPAFVVSDGELGRDAPIHSSNDKDNIPVLKNVDPGFSTEVSNNEDALSSTCNIPPSAGEVK